MVSLEPSLNLPAHRFLSKTTVTSWCLTLLFLLLQYIGHTAPAPGSVDPDFHPAVNDSVHATALLGDGKMLIGGAFTTIDSLPHQRIARLNADGSTDEAFVPEANNTVRAIAVLDDGKILIAGDFTSVNGQPRSRIARLHPNGSLDSNFAPTVNGYIRGLAVQPDGRILIGGYFSIVGPAVRNGIARLNPDGTVDPDFDPDTNNEVDCIAVQPDGKIIFGGYFTSPRMHLARANADGELDTAFAPTVDGPVLGITLKADGRFYIAGAFEYVNGAQRYGVAGFDPNVSLNGFGAPGLISHGAVQSLALEAGDAAYLGGGFQGFLVTCYNFGRVGLQGGSFDTDFQPNQYNNAIVRSLAQQGDGQIILGGDFTTISQVPRQRLARITNSSGTESLLAVDEGTVRWERSGRLPEISSVSIDLSTDDGFSWIPLGPAAFTNGTWQVTGLSLPSTGLLRGRGRVTGGAGGNSSWPIQTIVPFSPGAPPVATTAPATEVLNISANLHGEVDANRLPTTVKFEYGLSATALTQTATATLTPDNGDDSQPVSAALSGLQPSTTYYYRVVATNANATAAGSVLTFTTPTPPPAAPTVTIAAANPVSYSSATLVGTVNANGSPTSVYFEYGLDTTYGQQALVIYSPSSGITARDVGITIGSLLGQTTYHYRLVATNSVGTTISEDRTFTTTTAVQIDHPSITNLTPYSATLRVSLGLPSSSGKFEYGQDNTYGQSTPVASFNPTDQPFSIPPSLHVVTANLTGLQPSTTYHYRVVATLFTTAAYSIDYTFTTPAPTPIVTLSPVTTVSSSSAIVKGTVNPQAQVTTAQFEYGLDATYGRTASVTLSPNNGSTAQNVQAVLSGLLPSTTYHYRLSATNSAGTSSTNDGTFTTVALVSGTQDPTFLPSLSNASLTAIQPDGKILVVSTTGVAPAVRSILTRLNPDGTTDATFNAGTGAIQDMGQGNFAPGVIYGLAVQPDGKILVGGIFNSFSGATRRALLRLLPNGSLDEVPDFDQAFQYIYALVLQPDGKILVGGLSGDTTHLRRFHANGTPDPAFDSGSGFKMTLDFATIASVSIQSDGKILVAGRFDRVNGQIRNQLARLEPNGQLEEVSTFDPGTGPNGTVNWAAVAPDQTIFLRGNFTNFSGVACQNFVHLAANGSVLSAANATGTASAPVFQASGEFFGGTGTSVIRYGLNGAALETLPENGRPAAMLADGGLLVTRSTAPYLAKLNFPVASASIVAPSSSQIRWLRDFSAPDIYGAFFELSTDSGATWTPLGLGDRITGGWTLDTDVPSAGLIRARGFAVAAGGRGTSIFEQISPITDPLTLTPGMSLPAIDSVVPDTVAVSYVLTEDASAGTAKLIFTSGDQTRELVLNNANSTEGTHSFTFSSLDPMASGQFASASALLTGSHSYTVTLSYEDIHTNTAATATSTNVTIDNQAPTLSQVVPSTNNANLAYARLGDTLSLSFTASEALQTPTVTLSGQTATVTGGPTQWTASLVVGAGGPTNGEVAFSIAYQDLAGNAGTAVTAPSGSAARSIVDTLAPTITGPLTTRQLVAEAGASTAVVPNYTTDFTITDSHLQSVQQTPVTGATVGSGNGTVMITARDDAGNQATVTFGLNVVTSGPSTLAQKRDEVPDAGTDLRIPDGTTWSTYGPPSITKNGAMAGWLSTVIPPKNAGSSFQGIFFGPLGTPALKVRTGAKAPNASGTVPTGAAATFSAFRTPIFAGDEYAFAATLKGTGVATTNDTGIWHGEGTALALVAREGSPAPGAGSVRFTAFSSVAMPAPGVIFFTATVSAPAAQDFGLWVWTPANGVQQVLREGVRVSINGIELSLVSFKALISDPTSPGHGRYDAATGTIDALLTFPKASTVLATIDKNGTIIHWAQTKVAATSAPLPTAFGLPSSPGRGLGPVAATTFAPGTGGRTAANNVEIVDYENNTVLAQKDGFATDAAPAKFRSFKGVAAGFGANDARTTVFSATLAGATAGTDTGLWASVAGTGLKLVAREGSPATDIPGAKWKSFTSFSVLEGRGPMFVATLVSGAKLLPAGSGFWATDSTGTLRLIFKKGDDFAGRKLKTFFLLGAVSGSAGQQRASAIDDLYARVIFRADFEDGSSAVMTRSIP